MKLYQLAIITKEDMDGFATMCRDGREPITMFKKIIAREGIRGVLAEIFSIVAKKFKKGTDDSFIH